VVNVAGLFISGWQTRWFILDNGVLAYYKSQEEVNQGCKGSMKVTACEIIGSYNWTIVLYLYHIFFPQSSFKVMLAYCSSFAFTIFFDLFSKSPKWSFCELHQLLLCSFIIYFNHIIAKFGKHSDISCYI